MAASARYQTTALNIDGIEYRISIYDNTYSGAVVSDFLLDNKIFELRYDSGSDENFAPIIGSELTLNIVLKKDATRDDSTLFTFLKNIVAQNSQKYYIVIEEKISGNWVQYWRGNVVQNQSSYMNDAIEGGKLFVITANDFAYLNEKPFLLLGATASDYTLRTLITIVLQRLGVFDDFTSGINYWLLHNINWYEARIPILDRPTTDILDRILAYDNSFAELNDDRTENSIKTIEVLKTICIIFGAKLIQSGGKFYIIQLQNYANTTSNFFQRDLDYNNPSIETISPRVAVNNNSGPLYILQGAQYTALRPAYSTYVKKPNYNTIIFSNPRDNFSLSPMEATVGNSSGFFSGGNNNILKFVFNLINEKGASGSTIKIFDGTSDNFLAGLTSKVLEIIIRIKTSGGTFYYLNRSGTTLTWTTTSSVININFSNPNIGYKDMFDLTLLTPELPNFDFDEVYCSAATYYSGRASSGAPVVSGYGYFKGQTTAKFLENSQESDNTIYRANISPKPFDPRELQIEDILLYDTEIRNNKGTMLVNTSSGLFVTNDWSVGGGIPTFNILELVAVNGMALNANIKEVLTATIKGRYYPHQLLTYDSKQWHIKQATYNAGENQWNGEWFELTYSETGVSVTTNTGNGEWVDTAIEG